MTTARIPSRFAPEPSSSLSWRQRYTALRPGGSTLLRRNVVGFALELPQFPLEFRLRGTDGEAPVVLTDTSSLRVSHSSPAAARAGVRPGMDLRKAQTLCPALGLLAREPTAETAMQRRIESWLGYLGLNARFETSAEQGADDGACALHVADVEPRQQALIVSRVRRDLRRLGFRASSFARAGATEGVFRTQTAPTSVSAGDDISLDLTLPWPAERPHALNLAVERLIDDLRFEAELRGREVDWIQLQCVSARGERFHHRHEVSAGLDGLARVGFELRRWRHTTVVPPISMLALRAGLTPGAFAAHGFIGYSSTGIQ
jgi:hypothetical protein